MDGDRQLASWIYNLNQELICQTEETSSNHSDSIKSFHDENSNDTPDIPFSHSEMIGDPISEKKLQDKQGTISSDSRAETNITMVRLWRIFSPWPPLSSKF